MGDLSKDFSRNEYSCKCGCGFSSVNRKIVEIVLDVEEHWGKDVEVITACRCRFFNSSYPGAARDTLHPEGKAIDIRIEGVEPEELFAYLSEKYPSKYGIGLYKEAGSVHLDIRPYRARWKME